MILDYIEEPELEFGLGNNVCPKAGIDAWDVYDHNSADRKEKIYLGAIGTSSSLSILAEWLDRLKSPIEGKADAKQPSLFRDFCGVSPHWGFKTEFVSTDRLNRKILKKDVSKISSIAKWNDRIQESVNLFLSEIKFVSQNRNVDVILCIIPNKLYDCIYKQINKPVEDDLSINEYSNESEWNFRRLLKAKAMKFGKPLQLVREKSLISNSKGQQDEATKAWNFSTAIYYKAGQTPWKLNQRPDSPSVCYVGISLFRSRDRRTLNISMAQIFDELGNGVILRGTPVDIDKTDRRPYISNHQAYNLLYNALKEYKTALKNMPGRLVVHKTALFREEELSGFKDAADDSDIDITDFVSLIDTDLRVFRKGIYPPYRGTNVVLDAQNCVLYTRGTVPAYKTYPGMYIPQPIQVRISESEESQETICNEILSLTKMNWNNMQFDGKFPITIECSRRVGDILKYLDESQEPQISYRFYM